MKLTNKIENIIIAVVVALLSLVAFNYLKFKPMQTQFEKQLTEQNKLIEKLGQKETYKIENSFDKIKAKNGEVDINIKNELNENDSTTYENDKRSFWTRIFNKHD